jgi:hypothetical protein
LGSFASEEMQKQFDVQVPQFSDDEKLVAKRKVAMLLPYCGTNYTYGGFQINGGQPSLQAQLELEFAMYKALSRFISKTNFWISSQVWLVHIGDITMDTLREKVN